MSKLSNIGWKQSVDNVSDTLVVHLLSHQLYYVLR